MVDVAAWFGAVLHSAWLLPLLVALIAVDAPFPIFPSETLLLSAFALALSEHRVAAVVGLFVTALVGSAAGDLITFGLGRTSHRLLASTVDTRSGLASWVRGHVLLRPGVAIVGARFVPGGRLVSTAAAGRYGLPLRRFLPWSLVSSAAWSGYMLLVGLLLGPFTGDSPVLCLLAGAVMAVLTAGAFALVQRVRGQRRRAAVRWVPAGPLTDDRLNVS